MGADKLGNVDKTVRGFEVIVFEDLYGESCSLQASSLAKYEKPGTAAVWLGCEENSFNSTTGEALSPRMHLDHERVRLLVAHLLSWLSSGTFDFSDDSASAEWLKLVRGCDAAREWG